MGPNTGAQLLRPEMDPRFRGDDGVGLSTEA